MKYLKLKINKFSKFSGKYLPDVINALPVASTQQKALEIITHVKKRLSSRKEVKGKWGHSLKSSPSIYFSFILKAKVGFYSNFMIFFRIIFLVLISKIQKLDKSDFIDFFE